MQENDSEGLKVPSLSDKELLAMNQLMADPRYRIKAPSKFLIADRTDRISPDFVLYTLNDYLGHIQKCVASTYKMFPVNEADLFFQKLENNQRSCFVLVSIVRSFDIKQLNTTLQVLQKHSHEITVDQLIPFVKLLFRPLLRLYYLGSAGVAKKYRFLYSFILKELPFVDSEGLKTNTNSAIREWNYIFEHICAGMYPLVLRMTSTVLMSSRQLFYSNGSRLLDWLNLVPADILMENSAEEPSETSKNPETETFEPDVPDNQEKKEGPGVPADVQEGLSVLERLFPDAGWENLEVLQDLCPYFQPLLQFKDVFSQLASDNPLQQTLVFLNILEELFQGLRLIKFMPLPQASILEENMDINKILEDWILYQETVFDKIFSKDLKEYTHQIYTQPEYNKAPYGRMLLSNMYSLIKSVYLPYFDIQMYGISKMPKDERLPPFYVQVARLKILLTRYNDSIQAAPAGSDMNVSGSVPGVLNPWETYKFDIPNIVSRRLDAVCGGKHSRLRTNAFLIRITLSILNVLDWWINNKESYAYANNPYYLYRVIEPGSSVPAFGVKVRTDTEAVFIRHLKANTFLV